MSDLPLLSFGLTMEASPELRPFLNVGFPFDIGNGQYAFGIHGESVLNGGISPFIGIAGLPNNYKTALLRRMILAALSNYPQAFASDYDTEVSGGEARWKMMCAKYPKLDPDLLIFHKEANPTGRLLRTDAAVAPGDVYFENIKNYCTMKHENRTNKRLLGTTPFKGKDGNLIVTLLPSLASVDSFSRMTISAVDAILDKNSIGESGNNMTALREMHAKNQMVIQMPVLTAQAALYFIGTAHVSEKHQLDPYALSVQKLAFLKNNLKLKYVPDQFNFLAQDLYFVFSATKHVTKDNTPQYPRDSQDNSMETTDLMKVTMMNLRGKSGMSGLPYELLVSQSDGYKEGLSAYQYLRQYGGFGIGGHDKSYYLELHPDVKLSRTTIYSKLDTDPMVHRAMVITAEICQIRNLWRNIDPSLLCTPAELYKDLKEMGYDWNTLLNTRAYWTFAESNDPMPFLSTMDLLRMRKGLYKPYWMS